MEEVGERGVGTCRKHGKKEPQLFSHYGFFDHHDLQSLNDHIFVFFGFTTITFKLWGHIIHHQKGIFKTFLAVCLKPPNS